MDILDEDDSDDSDSSTSIDSNDGSMEDLEQVYNNTLKEIDTETGSTQANYNLLVETAMYSNCVGPRTEIIVLNIFPFIF